MAVAVQIFAQTGLTKIHTGSSPGNSRTSTVNEPSVANNGRHVLLSGNWFAARSADSGSTWVHVDPFTFFPTVDGGFCCDQTLHYDQAHDLTIWLLQYVTSSSTNSNTLRVAVKAGPLDTPGGWRMWDLKPGQLDSSWAGEWFDYNHSALSNRFLYVGTNAFGISDDNFTRSIVLRIPLHELALGARLTIDRFVSTSNFSLRCAQGASDTMYFFSHNSNRELALFEWPESSAAVTITRVPITPWAGGVNSAPVAGSPNWLERSDSRITAAWVSGGKVGAMWTANRSPPQRPMPFVRAVRIDTASKTVVDEPDVWGATAAFAYPEACPNIQGVVGVSLFTGGGARHPTHLVGFRDDATGSWKLKTVAQSTHSPNDAKWGDYLTCRRHSPDGFGWIASGYSLQGGGSIDDVVPHFVHFGIDQHAPAADRWFGI